MKAIKIGLFSVLLMVSVCAGAQVSPVPMLERASNQIIDTLKSNKSKLKKDQQLIHHAVEQYLLPIVDVQGMARSVLGRKAWNQASMSEKKAFTTEFTQLVIRTYANPLAEYSNETVKFLPQRAAAEERFSQVNSVIVRDNGKDIPLTYRLVSKNGEWKVYDLSVEGVSLLQSFRNQFGQVLQTTDMNGLIRQMREKKVS